MYVVIPAYVVPRKGLKGYTKRLFEMSWCLSIGDVGR